MNITDLIQWVDSLSNDLYTIKSRIANNGLKDGTGSVIDLKRRLDYLQRTAKMVKDSIE